MDVFDALNILGIEYNAKPKEAGQAYIRLMTENLEDDAQRAEIREAYERVIGELPYKMNTNLYFRKLCIGTLIILGVMIVLHILLKAGF